MSIFKGWMPYIVGGVTGAAILYLVQVWNDQPSPNEFPMNEGVEKPDAELIAQSPVQIPPQVELTEETEPERIYCPEQKECPPVQCPQPEPEVRWKTRTVYKDRIVYVPKKVEPGCYADWSKGKFSGYTSKDMNLKCTFDHIKQKIKTQFFVRDGFGGTLRRGKPIQVAP